ncbi:MAG: Flp pilus assembly protein CpaB [Gemmatimonadales bacterium]
MRLRNAYRLLAAALCAGVATYLTVVSFSSRSPPPRPLVAVPEVRQEPARGLDTKTVIVAAKSLQFGAALTAEALTEVQWPSASVPPGAFSTREALLGSGGQRTVLTSIAPNEPIVASKITGPGQRGSLSAVIEDGMKAVTIRVDDVLGVAGFVQPGDRVDVIWTHSERRPNANGRPSSDTAYSTLLLQNVRVLAIDQILDRGPQAKPAKAVTVEVNAEGAQKVALSANVGQLSLALLRAGSRPSSDYRRIGVEDLGGERTPGAPASPPQKAGPDGKMITVTRGTERTQYEITESGRREIKVSGKTVLPTTTGGAPLPE